MISALLLLAGTPSSQGHVLSPTSGTMLHNMCAQLREVDGRVYSPCTSYILGVYDGLSQSLQVYTSTEVKTQQIVAVALKGIEQRPDSWHHHAWFLIRDALVRAFPCGKSR